jgi:adenylyltransferase/sulfurtransferase
MPRQIGVHELKTLLDAGAPVYLVDVRQPWEHDRVHLPGDVLVPLDELESRTDEITPPEDALVVAYCHHGIRSLGAAAILERLHPRVASLSGGIDRWSIDVDPTVLRY